MSKPSLELEHSQAAGAEAVLVMIALLMAILLSAAAFANTMARGLEHQATRVSQATELETRHPLATETGADGWAVMPRGRHGG